jgi:hypothetical protein
MLDDERRRDYRFAITLNGSFSRGRIPVLVENVAYRGLLLSAGASTPLVVGQLNQFGILLPGEGNIALQGVPVRVGAPDADGTRILAVRLIGIEPRWERFVRALHAKSGRVLKIAREVAHEYVEKGYVGKGAR